jgi:hypothetical protein
MAGPVGPLRTDDGPACRVCGCTQNNACVTGPNLSDPTFPATCYWVPVKPGEKPLCSACEKG